MLEDVYSLKNLELAWKWIKSNPDKNYKQFFRSSYQKHELIRDSFLHDLHEDLANGTYEPSHACKVYLPKKSGVLRPYSLLTVRDQIVYQAFANIIAESLVKKLAVITTKRYLVTYTQEKIISGSTRNGLKGIQNLTKVQ